MGCNQILDRYIEQLIETSTPQAPAWNIEKLRAGKENTWNYIDGCMTTPSPLPPLPPTRKRCSPCSPA